MGSGCLLAYLLGCLLTGPPGWRCGARDALLLLLLWRMLSRARGGGLSKARAKAKAESILFIAAHLFFVLFLFSFFSLLFSLVERSTDAAPSNRQLVADRPACACPTRAIG